MMTLPAPLEAEFWQEYRDYEASKSMQYVTSVERFGIRQGLLEGIKLGLKLRFGTVGLSLLPEISTIEDLEQLRAILPGLETVSNIDELRQIYQSPTTDTQPLR